VPPGSRGHGAGRIEPLARHPGGPRAQTVAEPGQVGRCSGHEPPQVGAAEQVSRDPGGRGDRLRQPGAGGHHVRLSGFLARAQGLHEGAVAAISADNPYAAFTLLRAYAENAAAILYVKDHPAQLERFWRDTRGPGVQIGRITNHAVSRFGGFKDTYSELSRYAHPQALSLLASSRVVEGEALQWSSAPAFKADHDAVMACAWVS
jgi:hypothetical protein